MIQKLSKYTLLICLGVSLASCNLRPLYAGGSGGAVATHLGDIQIEPIAGKTGWLLRNALRDKMAKYESTEAKYRLIIEIDDKIAGFGVRSDDRITRERRTLRARYQLVQLSDSAIVLDATAGSDAGIDVVSSEYATLAAEDTAIENLAARVADQIIVRLSLFAREQAGVQ